ncbi:MAG TPA: DUF2336 domain-containing protein [Alphaproteobacteria bacterium]|nr:DUF2336 domain-containing protein [Alphaproteobacteria bacterium]
MDDFGRLYDLARDRSRDGRHALVQAVTAIGLDPARALGEPERALVSDILHQLIRDTEREVRQALAERLAGEPAAPREVVVALAGDEIAVARPVLGRSPVLTEADLLALVEGHPDDHRAAIAGRPALVPSVCDALIARGGEAVLLALLANAAACASPAGLVRLADRARAAEPLQAPLLRHPRLGPALGPELALRLHWFVSAALRGELLARHRIPAERLDAALEAAVADLAGAVRRARVPTAETAALARRLVAGGAALAPLLVQALRLGSVPLFALLLGEAAGLPEATVEAQAAAPGGEDLAVSCRAAGIDKAAFASIFLLSRRARPGDQVVDPRELSRVLALYDRLTPAGAAALLRRLGDGGRA